MKKIAQFTLQRIIVGLTIAFAVLYLIPGFVPQARVVKFLETSDKPGEITSSHLSVGRLKSKSSDTVKGAAPAMIYTHASRVITQQARLFMQDLSISEVL